jgi:3-phenylpropionate/cinnamic acid dioxygenase small subunit
VSDDDLAARIAAELDIRNVISRIAILADEGDLDEYIDQFTEDSVWNYPPAPRRGRGEIRGGAEARRAEGLSGPGSDSRHLITTVAVRVDGQDRGVADSYFVFLQNTTTAPTILNTGAYHDTFVREGQVWRLARREITFG